MLVARASLHGAGAKVLAADLDDLAAGAFAAPARVLFLCRLLGIARGRGALDDGEPTELAVQEVAGFHGRQSR